MIQEAEFETFCNLRNAKSDELYGGHIDGTADERKAWFDALNSITPGTDGFSKDDAVRSQAVINGTIISELIAAQAQPSE